MWRRNENSLTIAQEVCRTTEVVWSKPGNWFTTCTAKKSNGHAGLEKLKELWPIWSKSSDKFDQYVIHVDGSGRVTLCNKKFLRKYESVNPRKTCINMMYTNRSLSVNLSNKKKQNYSSRKQIWTHVSQNATPVVPLPYQ